MLAMVLMGGAGTAHAITPAPVVAYPAQGTGTFTVADGAVADGGSPRSGTPGKKLTFRVAVEGGILGIDPDAFAAAVASSLVDARLVGDGEPFDFTVFLATPATRDALCGGGFDRVTSCRHGDRVVVNVERWELGDGATPLPTYRRDLLRTETDDELRALAENG